MSGKGRRKGVSRKRTALKNLEKALEAKKAKLDQPQTPSNSKMEDPAPVTSASKTKLSHVDVDSSSERKRFPEGFRLVDFEVLKNLLGSATCSSCKTGSLTMEESGKMGLASRLTIGCSVCGTAKELYTSKRAPDRTFEVNIRAIHACCSVGLGLEKSKDLFAAMNMPGAFCDKTYYATMKKLSEVTSEVAQKSMRAAANEVRAVNGANEGVCECTMMFDGTWHKRGHSSKHGVVSAISVDTVKVVDVDVESTYCAACRNREGMDKQSEAYLKWYAGHEKTCSQNHSGSANSMESKGIMNMYKRSRDERNLEYTGYVGDGDTKSCLNIQKEKVYGEKEVIKKECVGHVQKRMGNRLKDLKTRTGSRKLSDGKTMGGRGRLTAKKCDEMQTYYGLAIRRNKGDLEGMKNAVWATLDHLSSSDNNPNHARCPQGEDSWCKYRVNEARRENGEHVNEYKHGVPLPVAVVSEVEPVYKALGDEKLLSRCLDGYTQNACESFNSVVWTRCPKDNFVGRDRLQLAVFSAVCVFNDGRVSMQEVLKKMGINCGRNYAEHLLRRDKARVKQSLRRASKLEQKKRISTRRSGKEKQELAIASEGPEYESGAL